MRLGQILKRWRVMSELNLRTAAKMMGTSTATLSRIERGENPDGKTLAAILRWILSDWKPPKDAAKQEVGE